eukprot:CAMPEP_0194027244 /NCGR_PEP_ID=MMETSP0009_2-20130614/1415_1 /TAXON_ID=210454 /ORGANISM="Grammatophora oceanica, Strain CCMP 410" /LENGTH=304 /DNA_ID=CAMNT_0038666231 /DNA_START=196 /DNA_END=1110 /DNA_ORIENTATION=-
MAFSQGSRAGMKRIYRSQASHLFVVSPPRRTYLETLFRPDSIISPWAPLKNTDEFRTVAWNQLFEIDLPEGKCVGISLADLEDNHSESLSPDNIEDRKHWIHKLLHPAEVAYGASQTSDKARKSFFLGRLAMREALRLEQHSTAVSILKDEHGRPTVPNGYIGSISHKENVGVALVATCEKTPNPKVGIGIDIEQTVSGKRNIAPRVLTPSEIETLGRLKGISKEQEVMLRFSLKESIYKAMHPLVCQYVGFQEAEITPHQDGTASLVFKLKSGDHELFRDVTAHWRTIEDGKFFLTSGKVTLR